MKFSQKWMVVPYIPPSERENKNNLDSKLSSVLQKESLPEDIKIKEYNQELNKNYQLSHPLIPDVKLTTSTTSETQNAPTSSSLIPSKDLIKSELKKTEKKKKVVVKKQKQAEENKQPQQEQTNQQAQNTQTTDKEDTLAQNQLTEEIIHDQHETFYSDYENDEFLNAKPTQTSSPQKKKKNRELNNVLSNFKNQQYEMLNRPSFLDRDEPTTRAKNKNANYETLNRK
jgi:hypothetical protein